MRNIPILMVCVLCVVFLRAAIAGDDQFRFVVTGDSRGGDNGINAVILTELTSAVIAEGVEAVVFTGDLVADGTQTQLEHWVQTFMEPLTEAGIMVYPCRGNHDSNITAWNTVFSGTYALPGNGPAGEVNLTYSAVHKNALFVSLDEYTPSHPFKVNQPWLDDQLASNTLPHVFVFGHLPAFAVNHPDCLAMFQAERDIFWDSVGHAGGRVYFCGHDHFYDHAWANTSDDIPIHQFIAGSAGAPMHDWSGVYSEAERVTGVMHLRTNGYVVADVDGPEVHMVFKERMAPNVYIPSADVFHYSISGEGEEEEEGEGIVEGEGGSEGEGENQLEGLLEGQIEGAQEGTVEGMEEGEGFLEGAEEGLREGEGGEDIHSADLNGDGRIHVSELLRVIQFYNSDGFHCQADTEDEYAPGPGGTFCVRHDSDYAPQDWRITLSELMRLILFYNSSGYHACAGSEDGFCANEAPRAR